MSFVLHMNDPNRATVLANCLAFIGKLSQLKPWQITIEHYAKERSDAQNHALFGVAYPAIECETGHTKDELHEAFCKRFFGTVDKDVMGLRVSKPFRTTTRNAQGRRDVIGTVEFADFYSMVQGVAAEAGIYVPDPDPLWRQRSDA